MLTICLNCSAGGMWYAHSEELRPANPKDRKEQSGNSSLSNPLLTAVGRVNPAVTREPTQLTCWLVSNNKWLLFNPLSFGVICNTALLWQWITHYTPDIVICTGNTKISNKWSSLQDVRFLVRESATMGSLFNNNSNNSAVIVKRRSTQPPERVWEKEVTFK